MPLIEKPSSFVNTSVSISLDALPTPLILHPLTRIGGAVAFPVRPVAVFPPAVPLPLVSLTRGVRLNSLAVLSAILEHANVLFAVFPSIRSMSALGTLLKHSFVDISRSKGDFAHATLLTIGPLAYVDRTGWVG